MELKDAIVMMNPGDIFSPDSTHYTEFIMNDDGSLCTISNNQRGLILTKDILTLKGKIIKQYSSVLSLEKLTTEIFGQFSDINSFTHMDIMNFGRAAHKNGRLERDVEYKDLVHCVEKNCNSYSATAKALKNLKPL